MNVHRWRELEACVPSECVLSVSQGKQPDLGGKLVQTLCFRLNCCHWLSIALPVVWSGHLPDDPEGNLGDFEGCLSCSTPQGFGWESPTLSVRWSLCRSFSLPRRKRLRAVSHKSTFHYGTATTCLLEVVEKDALIQEKEKLYVQLKNIIARLSIAACSLYIYIYICAFADTWTLYSWSHRSSQDFVGSQIPHSVFGLSLNSDSFRFRVTPPRLLLTWFRQPGPEVAEQLAWCTTGLAFWKMLIYNDEGGLFWLAVSSLRMVFLVGGWQLKTCYRYSQNLKEKTGHMKQMAAELEMYHNQAQCTCCWLSSHPGIYIYSI